MKLFSKWQWEILSPLAGFLLTLSFAPYNYSYLAIISLVFALLSWRAVSPRRAALRGFLYGAGLFCSGVFWVYISIHDYGGAHFIGAGLLTAFFCLFWALFPSLTAYLIAKLSRGQGVGASALIAAGIWILVEYFRGYLLLNGFPWLQVAYSQLETPLAGYVPILGGYGAGFMLLLSTALLAGTLQQRTGWGRNAVALALIWGGGFLLQWIDWTDPVKQPIKVSLIQGNVSQDKKWLPEYRIKTLIKYRQLTEQHWNSDVVIWPETAIPAFYHQVEEFFINPLEQQARQHNTDLIVSLPAKGKTLKENYNMVVTLGEQRGDYKKNHLLPFGEYLPLQPLSGYVLDLLQVNLGNFLPGGDDQALMKAGGYSFAASICYEDAFASAFLPALPEAAYLVNVTNDAWFGDSIEPHQHLQIARMRALETGRYLLRATNTGVTAVVDAKGGIVEQAPLFEQAVVTADIYPMTGMTPYAWVGDQWIIAVLALLLMVQLIVGRVKRR
ncbi:apolipoprotein N-acyltransferase [Methylomarinum sp. Ch1-1]|uniref:Apolipoprotein N-acyltransferase n=1 Tax=Methylomarinum roseum TaxID=3067653 RepID=A0AAU7NUB7_9GAMM|nr:apolipoprotein N-acyltransferase [Methylomarinum sp. Ch1-1]MDP4519304.1 apolipoprotein N-acyltransferase [Methylomarinum sp. Ch1-1]